MKWHTPNKNTCQCTFNYTFYWYSVAFTALHLFDKTSFEMLSEFCNLSHHDLALSDFTVCTLGLMQMIFADADELLTVGYVHVPNTAILVSLFSIFSIAIDPYVLTVHPLKHRLLLNGKKIAIWIVSMWLLGFYQLVKILIFGSDQKEDRLIFVTVFLTFSLVTFFIYILIYFTLKRRERVISQQQSQSGNRVLQEAFLKTIMIVAFVQIVTLVPVCITDLVGNHVGRSSGGEFSTVGLIVFEMYCLNFALNPLLYLWRLKKYRETFRLVFCRKLC